MKIFKDIADLEQAAGTHFGKKRPSDARCRTRVTVEREGGDKPVCVAVTLALLVA